jgi:hypothetical protein
MSSALRPTCNLEDQVPVFMSPSDRVAQLYPKVPDSLIDAFYDSQGTVGVFQPASTRGVAYEYCDVWVSSSVIPFKGHFT